MARARLLLVISAVLAAGIAVAVVVRPQADESPRTYSAGSEEFVARSLLELLAASDAVIEGTVLEAGPGRTVDLTGDGQNVVQMEQATVRVDRILAGSVASDVVLVEEYYGTLQHEWQEGVPGYFFLHEKDESDVGQTYYRLTSSQGRFDVSSDVIVASNDTMSWVTDLERLQPDEFAALIGAVASEAGQDA